MIAAPVDRATAGQASANLLFRLHPLVKLVAGFTLQVAAVAFNSPSALTVLAFVSCLGLILARRGWLLAGLVIVVGATTLVWGVVPLGGQNLSFALRLGAKLVAVFAPGILLGLTTSPVDVFRLLSALHLPLPFVLASAVMIRFIPALIEANRRTREVIALRFARVPLWRRVFEPDLVRAIAIPTLFHAYAGAERLATAAELRGLYEIRAWPKSTIPPLALRDYVLAAVVAAAVAVAFMFR